MLLRPNKPKQSILNDEHTTKMKMPGVVGVSHLPSVIWRCYNYKWTFVRKECRACRREGGWEGEGSLSVWKTLFIPIKTIRCLFKATELHVATVDKIPLLNTLWLHYATPGMPEENGSQLRVRLFVLGRRVLKEKGQITKGICVDGVLGNGSINCVIFNCERDVVEKGQGVNNAACLWDKKETSLELSVTGDKRSSDRSLDPHSSSGVALMNRPAPNGQDGVPSLQCGWEGR